MLVISNKSHFKILFVALQVFSINVSLEELTLFFCPEMFSSLIVVSMENTSNAGEVTNNRF